MTVGGARSREEGFDFSDEEEKKAVQLLDTSGDGLISFEEFVQWWVNKVSAAFILTHLAQRHNEDLYTDWLIQYNLTLVQVNSQVTFKLTHLTCQAYLTYVAPCWRPP